MRQTTWGQRRLFAAEEAGPRRYRVTDGTRWGPPTPSLALAVAQARAVAVDGRRAVIAADDGTAAAVTHGPAGFHIATADDARWPETVRHVLVNHG